MTHRRPYSRRRETARRLPYLERTGAFTLACVAVLMLDAGVAVLAVD
jgi:hypothetical protein